MVEMAADGNALLALLPDEVQQAVQAQAELVTVQPGEVLQRPGTPVEYLYFPVRGAVALFTVLEDGSEVMSCAVGSDGAINLQAAPVGKPPIYKARAELPCEVLRIGIERWNVLRAENPALHALSCAFADHLTERLQQALACKVKHDAGSQFCCWLSRLHAWHTEGGIPLTHQALARSLSLRRTTVTQIAKSLQDAGVIAYRRGVIRVVDRDALHQASCECYQRDQARETAFRCTVEAA